MNSKFTSSPWGFRYWNFERYCRFMKTLAITHICVQFGDPEIFPLLIGTDTDEIEKYKQAASDNGLTFLETAITDGYKTEIPVASSLGAKYLRVCDNWEETEDNFKKVSATLKDIGRLANEYNLTVVVENHGGLMRTGRMCKKLLEEIGLVNVTLNYDPANFLYFGEDPSEALEEVLPLTAFTHFKSVKYVDGKPEYCRIEEGVIDYKKIFDKLLPVYDGYIGLEYENPSDVEKGTQDDFNTIKKILNLSREVITEINV
ncbi:MAG: sugar phosphate isomerase/epimerase [Candidatus Omnitrophica bacterium]|nr:sugar phosphate isomerase/epimerase [Candidatus Omnitrophota bacterium]